jgi:putative membrane protein
MTRLLSWLMALPLLAAPSSAWAQQGSPYYGHHMWDGGGWMFFGPLTMILFIAAIVVVIVLLVRWLGGSGHGQPAQPQRPPGKAPLDILKERFAKGEIDKDEFEERRKLLDD